jgi:hypothetical protein
MEYGLVLNRKLAVKFPVVIINNSKYRSIIEKQEEAKYQKWSYKNYLLINGLARFVP